LAKNEYNKYSSEIKSRPTVKYFVNSYDNLPSKGPVFNIKKISRRYKKAKIAFVANKKKPSSLSVNSKRQILAKSPETQDKKTFKITKA
jgi:hypothetical protein